MKHPALVGNRLVLACHEGVITRQLTDQVRDLLCSGLSMYTLEENKYQVYWLVHGPKFNVLVRLGNRYKIVPNVDLVTRLRRLGLEVTDITHGAIDRQEGLSRLYAELFHLCDPVLENEGP